jgi:hypothetical protein
VRDAPNFATADIDNQRFRSYTFLPVEKMFEEARNTDLAPGWARWAFFQAVEKVLDTTELTGQGVEDFGLSRTLDSMHAPRN